MPERLSSRLTHMGLQSHRRLSTWRQSLRIPGRDRGRLPVIGEGRGKSRLGGWRGGLHVWKWFGVC